MADVIGTNGADLLVGTTESDLISGGNGADVLDGAEGDDTLSGGNGTDTIEGGEGDDLVSGGNGDDIIYGGSGDDTLLGGNGNDTLIGDDESAEPSTFTLESSDQFQLFDSPTPSIGAEFDVVQGDTIAFRADGSFANIVWYPDERQMSVQLYSEDGTAIGPRYSLGSGAHPTITALNDGRFAATWEVTDVGVYAVILDSSGAPAGPTFKVNETQFGHPSGTSIIATPDGGFAVFWQSDLGHANAYNALAQFYNADGSPQGSNFIVNTTTTLDQSSPDATLLADGRIVVGWQTQNQDGSGYGIYAQVLDADGQKIGGEFRINQETNLDQRYSNFSSLSDGGFVATWNCMEPDGSYTVRAQVFGSDLLPSGSEIVVGTSPSAPTQDVAGLVAGGFVVTWSSGNHAGWGTDQEVSAKVFAADGSVVIDTFVANENTSGDQVKSSVVATADGGFIINWNNVDLENEDYGVYARKFNVQENALVGYDDIIQGGNGDDLIAGRFGSNFLTGGAGADTFIFDDVSGVNTVTDFSEPDVLDLSQFGFENAEAVVNASTQDGADVRIQLDDNDVLILQNFTLAQLASSNFVL